MSIGTYTDKHDEKAALYGFDSFEEFINFFRADKNPENNNDGSADGNGGPKKSKKVKELQEYYKHQQTIQEWENLGIWDDSVTYNSWFHAVGSYLTLVMPTARFNGLFNFFSKQNLKPLGLGSTGRTTSANLVEQMAMNDAINNPQLGRRIMEGMKDSRWLGWTKMQYSIETQNGIKVVVHYVAKWEKGVIIAIDDFKFK